MLLLPAASKSFLFDWVWRILKTGLSLRANCCRDLCLEGVFLYNKLNAVLGSVGLKFQISDWGLPFVTKQFSCLIINIFFKEMQPLSYGVLSVKFAVYCIIKLRPMLVVHSAPSYWLSQFNLLRWLLSLF